MTWFSDLHAGLLNVWTGTLLLMLVAWFYPLFDKKARNRLQNSEGFTLIENGSLWAGSFLMLGFLIFSIWVKIDTTKLLTKIGLGIFAVSLILNIIAYISYLHTAGNKQRLAGLYYISRNPIYLTTDLCYLGLSLAGRSWVLLLMTFLHVASTHIVILAEERVFEKRYKKPYMKFKEQVRRYI